MTGIPQVAHMLELGIATNLSVGQLHGQGFDFGVQLSFFPWSQEVNDLKS